MAKNVKYHIEEVDSSDLTKFQGKLNQWITKDELVSVKFNINPVSGFYIYHVLLKKT